MYKSRVTDLNDAVADFAGEYEIPALDQRVSTNTVIAFECLSPIRASQRRSLSPIRE